MPTPPPTTRRGFCPTGTARCGRGTGTSGRSRVATASRAARFRASRSKLGYLADLGVTTLWLGPAWKQRATGVDQNTNVDGTDDPYYEVDPADLTNPARSVDFRALELQRDDCHGYAIQDFGSVDPGSERRRPGGARLRGAQARHVRDLRYDDQPLRRKLRLRRATHASPLRPPFRGKDFRNAGDPYPFGAWLDRNNRPMARDASPAHRDDGGWPPSCRMRPSTAGREPAATPVTATVARAGVPGGRLPQRDFPYPPEEGRRRCSTPW